MLHKTKSVSAELTLNLQTKGDAPPSTLYVCNNVTNICYLFFKKISFDYAKL